MARLDRPFFFGARRLVAAAALTAAACGGQTADLATDPDGREETALATAPHTLSTATPDQENLLAACVGVRSDVPMAKRLVDIVLVVDNSGSMTDEIVAVQGSINGSFLGVGLRLEIGFSPDEHHQEAEKNCQCCAFVIVCDHKIVYL